MPKISSWQLVLNIPAQELPSIVGPIAAVQITKLLLLVFLSGSDTVILSTMGGWQTPLLEPSSVEKHLLPLLQGLASSCSTWAVVWLVEMQTGLSPVVPVTVVFIGTPLD